ncbi:alpha-amylase family protein [Herbiconiux sp. CPCC 203407]|uniref:Alpha-amylase family protein n=1 Tax=Herbiconiux oxytropis TaxID=2970915 RepID=A0AA41XFA4_9MICO|nr:alpha-amylase family protein [Herbiconiux oxytropis]MCS5722701.1 alpha-amylase family protein [Herbiconiux oxytropis]MCS5725398.1 alpha-amylase family protein [Herbiconiux oxytropis]
MRVTDTSDLWWKTAVVYCLDVETFLDWNGDGVGDFAGLAHRLDYLEELGVTCLWLMPFYPTPDRDDGYDIMDFYGVDERLGHLGDLVEVIRIAKDRGMRVIADLVINHTSDRHPWFKEARKSRDNPYRDYYVWRDEPVEGEGEPVFPDQETSNWELDEKTGQYYQHVFYKHQPDLNITNPVVRDEIAKIMGFWLQLGLSGFRVDAVPFLLDGSGVVDGAKLLPDPHGYLRSLRSFVGRRSGDGVLLGEVNLPREEQELYFGGEEGDELTMQFDFIAMQNLYLSLARHDARPLVEALLSRPQGSPDSQWANFVRNHDELTLDKLSDSEREEVFAAFGPEERMQVYGRGLVRRLPPMLEGDPRRIRMVYSLLFSLPGTPVLFYGEEIGMGENLEAEGRLAVRTPMQWTSGPTGGFSTARPSKLRNAVVPGGYAPAHINVQSQRRDPDSLYSFVRGLVQHYRASPEFGWGAFEVLPQPDPAVFAHSLRWDGRTVVALHNFAPHPLEAPLSLGEAAGGWRLERMLGGESLQLDDAGTAAVSLDGYGFEWLRLVSPEDPLQY